MRKGLLIIALSIFWSSCSEESNPRKIKTWISMSDTMVQRRVNDLQPIMDSLCVLKTDSLYKLAYDSIYQKRWAEMKYLLDSIQPNEPIHQ